MSSRSLVFKGALHLRFAVSERASEIPSYYIMIVLSKLWIDACWWLGEYKPLPFCLGTAYNACSMEDTAIS